MLDSTLFAFIRQTDPSLNVDLKKIPRVLLKGGKSSALLYRFTLPNGVYVLRLLPPETSQESCARQIFIAKQAGLIGIGPKVHFVDSEQKAFIMDYIPGRTVTPIDFASNNLLANFAKLLRNFHDSQVPFPLASSPFQRFTDFVARGAQKNIFYPKRFKEVITLMETIKAALKLHPIAHTPCHLDLNPLNILLSKERFFLVDWVNGGISDPYFDLATFTLFLSLNESETKSFLTHYFKRPFTELQWSRFLVIQPVRLFVIAAAFLSMPPENSPPDLYDTVLKEKTYPCFTDCLREESSAWPHFQIGIALFQKGLDLIDKGPFNTSLKFLQ